MEGLEAIDGSGDNNVMLPHFRHNKSDELGVQKRHVTSRDKGIFRVCKEETGVYSPERCLSGDDVGHYLYIEFEVIKGGVGYDEDLFKEVPVDPERPLDKTLPPDFDEGLVQASETVALTAG